MKTTGVPLTGPDAGQQKILVSVYRREDSGWYSYGSREHYADGSSISTAGFTRLVPERSTS